MKRIHLTIFTAIMAMGFTSMNGQSIYITDPDYDTLNPIDCNVFFNGSIQDFFDSGINAGNYADNENDTLVVCPDLATGSKVSTSFGINVGFTWNVDGSDSLYVYDGYNTNAPLLGVHNSVTDPNGFNHQASFLYNPKGCLTFVFISDGSINGTGWDANITCGNPPQPYNPGILAFINGAGNDVLNPSDTGYVDMCYGDSVMFVANPNFPYSLENAGTGYSQNIGNCTYEWKFSDGTTLYGDTVWFAPPNRAGYLVTLRTTDPMNYIKVIKCKIRVSTLPSFAGTMPSHDTICPGDTVELIAGVTITDTVGVDMTTGQFEIGGTFAGLTYLPDGSGINYTTSVNITDFLPGQTVTQASDIQKLCVTMEHSYLGDLEMVLSCPNAQQATIFNSFSGFGELVPGGFSGGTTFLGDAWDNNIGNPGVGWEYCFDSNNPTFSTMGNELASGNTVPTTISSGNAMNPNGIYTPEDPWSAFIGCPLNGNWTITIRDNLSIDDGYIFEWGVFFNPAINPNTEFYTPVIVNENWSTDPTIISGQNDTMVLALPDTTGWIYYTYNIEDDFGCFYDTTVSVYVREAPQVGNGGNACDRQFDITGTSSASGGVWTYQTNTSGIATFSPDSASLNPGIVTSSDGIYTFTFTDNICNIAKSIDVHFGMDPEVDVTGMFICQGKSDTLVANANTDVDYLWNTGETTQSIAVTSGGTYTVNVSNFCNSASDTAEVTTANCEVIAPNVFTPNGDGTNDVLYFSGLNYYTNAHLMIWNRWGNLVYENTDYQNTWEGKNKGGKKLPDGVYYFTLDVPDPLVGLVKGYITILH